MAYSNEIKNRFRNSMGMVYEILVLIADNNGDYVDFSNQVLYNRSLLTKINSVTIANENNTLTPVMVTQLSNIQMDNSMGYWDKPFPIIPR